MAGRGGLGRQTRQLGRAQLQSVAGAAGTLGGLEGLLEQARELPVDPGLEQQIVAGVRQQVGGAAGARTPGAQVGFTGASREAVGAAIQGAEAIRDSTFLRRFSAQQQVLGQLAQLTQGGFRGGPTDQLVQERAALRTTKMALNAERNMMWFKSTMAALGGTTAAYAGSSGG